jgi:transcriptional regulator with XRE-family HTH domain
MPRVKPDSERGYVGAWMRRERLARGWSETQVVEALPVKIRPDYYRQVEAGSGGKRPGPELLLALMELFGSRPEPFAQEEAPAPTADFAALVAEQSELITKQNELLANQVAVLERIASVLERLTPREGPSGLPQGAASDVVDLEYENEQGRRRDERSKRRDHAETTRDGSRPRPVPVGTGSSRSEPLR